MKIKVPQEAMEILQRRSYAMKKVNLLLTRTRPVFLFIGQLAIVSTCKLWQVLGIGRRLFHRLYLRDPEK
jgi:hypothetical protein